MEAYAIVEQLLLHCTHCIFCGEDYVEETRRDRAAVCVVFPAKAIQLAKKTPSALVEIRSVIRQSLNGLWTYLLAAWTRSSFHLSMMKTRLQQQGARCQLF